MVLPYLSTTARLTCALMSRPSWPMIVPPMYLLDTGEHRVVAAAGAAVATATSRGAATSATDAAARVHREVRLDTSALRSVLRLAVWLQPICSAYRQLSRGHEPDSCTNARRDHRRCETPTAARRASAAAATGRRDATQGLTARSRPDAGPGAG